MHTRESMFLIKTYSELIMFSTFDERFKYLMLKGRVGEETFGWDRWINQDFYRSKEWKRVRDFVIVRDNGCDLGIQDRKLYSGIFVHHINPININDIENSTRYLLDPEFLITVSKETHDALHYGNEDILNRYKLIERKPNDICPWRN